MIFNDTREINNVEIIPGKVVEKTFNVESDADDILTYNIKFNEITNTYNEDVVYTLIKDGKIVVEQTPMPKTKEREYIITNVNIEPGEKHEYVLKMEYLYKEEIQMMYLKEQ